VSDKRDPNRHRRGTHAGDVNIQVNLPAPKPDRYSWLKTLLPQLLTAVIAGGIGVAGGVIGARTAGDVQLKLEMERAHEAAEQRRRDKAEEIVTLIEKTSTTYIAEKKAMLLEPAHMALPSSDAERVTALVALYFPDANELARDYEGAGATQSAMLSEIAIAIARHSPPPDDSVTYQRTLAAGDIVTEKVLRDVGVSYKRRVPVTQPSAVRP
jgi:hypothetical protein